MSWTLQLRFFADSSKLENAERLFRRIQNEIQAELNLQTLEPHHKGGFCITARHSVSGSKWSDAVFDALQFLEILGYSWERTGNISESLDATSIKPKFSGVTLIVAQMSNG